MSPSGIAAAFIRIEHLTKRYVGVPSAAVDDLSLEIDQGETFGLVGSNGAGKSTTIKCLLGLAGPTSGAITVAGAAISREQLDRTAYVPEVSALYDWLTFEQHVRERRSEYSRFDVEEARLLADRFRLPCRRRVGKLSKGQRQLAALILAFAQHPSLMVLDEPTSGLDPIAQWDILAMIDERRNAGVTTIVSSHNIGQVERIATSLGIMEYGNLIATGSISSLRARFASIEAIFASAVPDISRCTDLQILRKEGQTVYFGSGPDLEETQRKIWALFPVDVRVSLPSLEEVYRSYLRERETGTSHAV